MPITYLDEEPKTKITYLDEENISPISKMKQTMEERPDIKKAAIVMTELAKSPFGKLALRLVGKSPEEINRVLNEFEPEAKTPGEKIAKIVTSTGASLVAATPIIRGVGALPLISKAAPLLKFATGVGTYGGVKEAIEGKPERIIPAAVGGFAGGLATGGLMKAGATIIPKEIPGAERIGSALGGVLAGKILGGTTEDVAFMGALGVVFPQKRIDFGKIGISRIRDYAANKANAIRPGIRDYWKKEVNVYGQAIDSLATSKEGVNITPLMEDMTNTMVKRGLYDPINEKWVKPLNKVDAQLVKSYESLARLWTINQVVPTNKVITEYRNIKNSASIDTPLGRNARFLSNDIINSIKNQIESDVFTKANARYADFRTKFDLMDKYIGVWKPSLETARAERFLTGGEIGASAEARKVAQEITGKTGQTLKGAKAVSAIKRFPLIKFLIRR